MSAAPHTPVDFLADAALSVQEYSRRVAVLEEAILEEKDDSQLVEFLRTRRDQRLAALDSAKIALHNSIRVYSEATAGVPDQTYLAKITLADDTLGSIASVLKSMLALGITSNSIRYALGQADGTH